MRMKISFTYLKPFFVCLALLAFTNFCAAMDEDEALFQDAQRGFNLYQEGKYSEASPLLKKAIEGGDFRFLTTYADICDRNLDDQDHHPTDAAYLYLKGAEIGDGDALSYLSSLSEDLVENITKETMPKKIKELIFILAKKETSLGVEFYQNEDYPRAAQLFKKAARKNNTIAQHFYGDICFHQLDGVPHSYHEAAMYYLLSARGGDTDLFSYLKAHIPGILEDEDYETQMKGIVGYWVREATLKDLSQLTSDKVNKYIMWVRKKEIDKTTAMKFPYLFERVLTAILCENEVEPVSVIDDVLVPQGKKSSEGLRQQPQQSCGIAASLAEQTYKAMNSPKIPAKFGPMYFNYFKSLDDKEKLKPPTNLPKMKPLYRLLLDSISEESPKNNAASQLSDISHGDYPWLWAGIMYWKGKYEKTFNFTSLSEEELLKSLTEFSPISEEDIQKAREKLEGKDIDFWPNNNESLIAKQYNDRMHVWFTNPLSWKTKIVNDIKQKFYEKLKGHTLDCSKEEKREILKTPILMFYCENLTLNNFSSTLPCYNALKEAQRYFVKLNLTISTSPDFNNTSKIGKDIQELVNAMYKREIDITITSQSDH